MRISIGGTAPYAPGQVIVDLIKRQRQSGTLKLVDASLLERLGVTESLRPRTLASLRQLGMIDETGAVTEVMEGFKMGSDAEYRTYLANFVKTVYGEVFDVVGDPATATSEAIDTAFRGFEPHGQRSRMVILFLSLCQEAGLVEEVVRERPSSVGRVGRTTDASKAKKAAAKSPKEVSGKSETGTKVVTPPPPPPPPTMDPLIAAYFEKLPAGGSVWPSAARQKYLAALSGIFDIVYEEGES